MLDIGLKFIGVVKTATKIFPMANLSVREMAERGDSICLVHKGQDGCVRLMALVWVDRDRRYFISSFSRSTDVEPIQRIRWRQTPLRAERISLAVPQPKVAEL